MWPTFAQPIFLVLLLLVPWVLLRWRRQGRSSLRYSSVGLLQGLPAGRVPWAKWGGAILRGLGLALLIVALAGPRWPDTDTRLPTEGISLALVVDISRSMDNRDFVWEGHALSRLEGVKKIFRLFVEGGPAPGGKTLPGRPQDLLCLVTYATRPETACPLTLDHAALLKKLETVETRTLLTDATSNPGDALGWAVRELDKAPTKRKVIVFLTDGESNVGDPAWKPRQAAQVAGNRGIPIYAINANPDTPPEEEKARAAFFEDQKRLKDVAGITKGLYFQATNGQALGEVYAQIDQLERSKIQSFEYARYHEGFAWFTFASLASWLSVIFFEATYWRRVP